MKPIQDASQIVGDDNCIQTTNPSNSKTLDESDLAEIEQIVKEKMVSGNLGALKSMNVELIWGFFCS